MPRSDASIEIEKSADEVFGVIHDYDRRLEWDTLLRKAELIHGATEPGAGVRSVCTGKWMVGGMAMETEYVSYERGRVAAVRLTNRPRFFKTFAATIKHKALDEHRSRTTYIYNFESRPDWLSPILNPIMSWALAREV
ncbi:MAG: SRPBCC family protein, partial [Verrucomicrobiota bacterium]